METYQQNQSYQQNQQYQQVQQQVMLLNSNWVPGNQQEPQRNTQLGGHTNFFQDLGASSMFSYMNQQNNHPREDKSQKLKNKLTHQQQELYDGQINCVSKGITDYIGSFEYTINTKNFQFQGRVNIKTRRSTQQKQSQIFEPLLPKSKSIKVPNEKASFLQLQKNQLQQQVRLLRSSSFTYGTSSNQNTTLKSRIPHKSKYKPKNKIRSNYLKIERTLSESMLVDMDEDQESRQPNDIIHQNTMAGKRPINFRKQHRGDQAKRNLSIKKFRPMLSFQRKQNEIKQNKPAGVFGSFQRRSDADAIKTHDVPFQRRKTHSNTIEAIFGTRKGSQQSEQNLLRFSSQKEGFRSNQNEFRSKYNKAYALPNDEQSQDIANRYFDINVIAEDPEEDDVDSEDDLNILKWDTLQNTVADIAKVHRKKQTKQRIQRWLFWIIPIILTLAILIAATVCHVYLEDRYVLGRGIKVSQMLYYLGTQYPLYLFCRWLIIGLSRVIENQFWKRSNVIYFIVTIKFPATLILFCCFNLGIFAAIFVKHQASFDFYYLLVVKIWGCLLLSGSGLLLAAVITKYISTKFHQNQHFIRVKKALQMEYYLHALSQSPIDLFHRDSQSGGREPPEIDLQKAELKQFVNFTEKDIKEFSVGLYKMDEYIRSNKLSNTLTDNIFRQSKSSVDSAKEAKKFAFYLWYHLSDQFQKQYIMLEDIQEYLAPKHAQRCFEILDKSQDGKISLEEFRDAVIDIYEDRKNLVDTLKDTRSVVGKIQQLLAVAIQLGLLFAYLAIFQVQVYQFWLTLSSIVFAFVFVFGNNIKNIYEGAIYLFSIHPFDVGDIIMIDTFWYKIEEILLLFTILSRSDGAKIFYPNNKMMADQVTNLSRSAMKWEGFIYSIDFQFISQEQFDNLEIEVRNFLLESPNDFTGQFGLSFAPPEDPLKVRLQCWIEYNNPGTDLGKINYGRTKFCFFYKAQILKMNLVYTIPPCRPIFDTPYYQRYQHLYDQQHGQVQAQPGQAANEDVDDTNNPIARVSAVVSTQRSPQVTSSMQTSGLGLDDIKQSITKKK